MADTRGETSLRSRNRRQGISAGHDPRNGPRDRSQASGRQQGRPSMESVRSTETKPRPRPRANDSTTNMVRKRMSVRYGQAADMSQGMPPMPGVPQIPVMYAQQNSSSTSLGHHRGGLDIRALRDPNLQPDQYLAQYLATASEQELAQYQQQLRNVKNRASTDWQRNVSQNRTQFIKISKEAEKLKGEMQTLQGLMNDLSVILEQASTTSGVSRDDSVRKRANRSSVANLEAMWSTQLQTLWKMIEGSQKFVAAIPGRHVVLEQTGWTELDAATWKPRRPAHLVLLNDNLLIALRKRKRMDPSLADKGQKAPTKIVAERCFSLQDIDVIDLESSTNDVKGSYRQPNQISRAITIRHGQESFTYRVDDPKSSFKNEFVLSFKRALEGLRRSEGVNNAPSKPSDALGYLASRDSAVTKNSSLVRSLSKVKERPDFLIDVEGKQRNMRWVEAQIDELDIEVALQSFEEAVAHVEFLRNIAKGLKHNAVAQDLITVKVNERAGKLADVLTDLLTANTGQLNSTQTYVNYLTRLDLTSRARIAYLAARTTQVHARVRTIVFEGNILSHITAISYVYFTLIRNTLSIYQQCFPPPMMSACVTWAKGQLDAYNEQLVRALSGVDKASDIHRQGLERARDLASIMDEVGLDFGMLIGIGLDA